MVTDGTVGELAAQMVAPGGDIPAPSGRCWRCGTPFAWSTTETLAACMALARAGAA